MGPGSSSIGKYIDAVLDSGKRSSVGSLFMVSVEFQQTTFLSKSSNLASCTRSACESIDMSNLTIFVKGFEYTVVAFVIGNRVHYKSIVRVGKVWHKFNPMSTDNSVILSWQEVKKLYSFNNILKDGVGSDCVECIFYLKKQYHWKVDHRCIATVHCES